MMEEIKRTWIIRNRRDVRFDDLAEIDPYSNAIFADIPGEILARGSCDDGNRLLPWMSDSLISRGSLPSREQEGKERENFEIARHCFRSGGKYKELGARRPEEESRGWGKRWKNVTNVNPADRQSSHWPVNRGGNSVKPRAILSTKGRAV